MTLDCQAATKENFLTKLFVPTIPRPLPGRGEGRFFPVPKSDGRPPPSGAGHGGPLRAGPGRSRPGRTGPDQAGRGQGCSGRDAGDRSKPGRLEKSLFAPGRLFPNRGGFGPPVPGAGLGRTNGPGGAGKKKPPGRQGRKRPWRPRG